MTVWYEAHRVAAGVVPAKVEETVGDLAAALARADREALSSAYREHHLAVRGFARRLLGDDVAAEDLVQETFVALPAAAARFEGRASLRTFVMSVAVNHARHFVRAAARRRNALARFSRETAGEAAPPPDESLDRDQLAAALFRGLDALPLDQRVAFVLCVIEERPSHEAAEIVGVPAPTVRSRVQAAKLRLRALLEEGGFR